MTLKSKHLHSMSVEGVSTHTICVHNINTDRITISTGFHRTGFNNGSKTNETCSNWLGSRAEAILEHVFEYVKCMPYNNPGFDFICKGGYKIDVKSSCQRSHGNWSPAYTFCISRNKTADYFLCLAFDNRENLNPLHIWLIPGSDINNYTGIGISESTVTKWDKYKIDKIDDIVLYCNNG